MRFGVSFLDRRFFVKSQFRDPAFRFRLAEALRVTGTSQRQFASAVGLNPAAVNRWLRGLTEPVRISYDDIARALGVPMDMIAPVVARRVTVASSAGNVSIPIRSARDVGAPLGVGATASIEMPEWMVSDWFSGHPADGQASAYRLLDDSLSPTLEAGAILVLDAYTTGRGWPASQLRWGRIYAVRSRAADPVVFRRVSFDGRAIICEPVNPDRARFPVSVILSDESAVPSFVPALVAGRIERFA